MTFVAGRPLARTSLILAGFVVSAVFMWIAVRDAHLGETRDALAGTDVLLLAPALIVIMLAFLIRCIRWRSLFTATARPALRHVVRALFVGYLVNALLPVRAGEAAAVVSLNRRAGTPIAESTATMLVQRAQDVLSLVFLLFALAPWLPHVSWLRAAGLIGLGLLLVLGIVTGVVLRFGDRPLHVILRPLRWLPLPLPAEAVERAPAQFVRGLAGLLTLRLALVSFALTTLSWLVLGIGFWVVMEACGLSLSPLAGVLVVIAIGLAMILPSSPAALGVFEGATIVALSAYGVTGSQALSYALVLHALNVLPLFVAAALAVAVRRAHAGRGAGRGASDDSDPVATAGEYASGGP